MDGLGPAVCVSVCLSVCLAVCLSVCLSVCLTFCVGPSPHGIAMLKSALPNCDCSAAAIFLEPQSDNVQRMWRMRGGEGFCL